MYIPLAVFALFAVVLLVIAWASVYASISRMDTLCSTAWESIEKQAAYRDDLLSALAQTHDSAVYSRLQTELTEVERSISVATLEYRKHAVAYNEAITTFPGKMVVGSKFRRRKM